MESELSYEQIRLNRVEENKKRMGELNLNKLAQSLRVSSSSSSSSKPSPVTFPFSSLLISSFLFLKLTNFFYGNVGKAKNDAYSSGFLGGQEIKPCQRSTSKL